MAGLIRLLFAARETAGEVSTDSQNDGRQGQRNAQQGETKNEIHNHNRPVLKRVNVSNFAGVLFKYSPLALNTDHGKTDATKTGNSRRKIRKIKIICWPGVPAAGGILFHGNGFNFHNSKN